MFSDHSCYEKCCNLSSLQRVFYCGQLGHLSVRFSPDQEAVKSSNACEVY